MAFILKYNQDRLLGSGAFAKVQLVTDLATGKQYAAKIAVITSGGQSAFKQEVEIYNKLKIGDSVTNMIEFFDSPEYVIIIEFQSGGDLFEEIVKRNPYVESDARKAFFQILTAIKFMHDQGIAHLDLKPENVLLDAGCNLKVTDFGLARCFDANNPKQQIFTDFAGTDDYMATEMHKYPKRDIKYDETVDEFAAGVILYILLTGHSPYVFRSDKRICKIDWKDEDWKDLQPSSKDLITSLMQKDPSERLTAEQALDHEWFAGSVGDADMPETRIRLKEFNARQKFKIGLLLITMSLALLDTSENQFH